MVLAPADMVTPVRHRAHATQTPKCTLRRRARLAINCRIDSLLQSSRAFRFTRIAISGLPASLRSVVRRLRLVFEIPENRLPQCWMASQALELVALVDDIHSRGGSALGNPVLFHDVLLRWYGETGKAGDAGLCV